MRSAVTTTVALRSTIAANTAPLPPCAAPRPAHHGVCGRGQAAASGGQHPARAATVSATHPEGALPRLPRHVRARSRTARRTTRQWRHMDLEFTCWQMLYLCVSPTVVCVPAATLCDDFAAGAGSLLSQHAPQVPAHDVPQTCATACCWRALGEADFCPCACAETKNQWARDDPAFVVITCGLLVAAASAYCAAYVHTLALLARRRVCANRRPQVCALVCALAAHHHLRGPGGLSASRRGAGNVRVVRTAPL